VLAGLLLGPVLALIAEAVPDYGGGGHTFRTCATCGAQEPLTLTYRSTVTAVSCRSCSTPVPRGRRAISLATALAFAVTGLVVGPEWPLIPLLALAASLIALSAVDLARYRLPDKLMLPSLVVVATLVVVVSVLGDFTEHLIPALVGAVVYFVFLAIPSFLMPAAIGFGDVKLAALLGLGAGLGGRRRRALRRDYWHAARRDDRPDGWHWPAGPRAVVSPRPRRRSRRVG